MKAFIIFTILFSVSFTIIFGAEMTEDKIKTAKECKEEEKATDEDMQAFVSHKLQQTPTGKCFLACIYEKNGSIKDGKIDDSAAKATLISDIGEKPFVDDIVEECKSTNNSDRCELASQFDECVHKGLATHHDTNNPTKN